MKSSTEHGRFWRMTRQVAVTLGMLVLVIILMMWLMGVFHGKIDEQAPTVISMRPVGDNVVVAIERVTIPVTEPAVGTVRPVHETSVASKILARVLEVTVKAGDRVSENDLLARLDDADLQARWEQAKATTAAMRAERDQAEVEYARVRELFDKKSAAQIELDRAITARNTAQAGLERAEQALREAEAVLSYATVRAPMGGVVVDKRVEAGDTVAPGQVLLTLYDPSRMQLVASVRESLTYRLKVGQEVQVQVEALGYTCSGQVSEIVPQAEAASRTFQVKVTGPCPPGVYAGMFGRLLIPLEEEQVLAIPRRAVRQVGQLQIVDVVEGDYLRRRVIQVGSPVGDGELIQVLSGLSENERVALPASATSGDGENT